MSWIASLSIHCPKNLVSLHKNQFLCTQSTHMAANQCSVVWLSQYDSVPCQVNCELHSASINLCRRWSAGDLWPSRIAHSPWAENVVHYTRSPVNSSHKNQWRGALLFLICALNKRLSKQSWGWWFEMPMRSLWPHCNALCNHRCAVSLTNNKFGPLSNVILSIYV